MLIYSGATSPLTYFYGGDSAFFILVGSGMTEGLLPYRDFFDMKGPYLFLIEFLGQKLCAGKMGIFLIQWVNLLISMIIIDKIIRNHIPDIQSKSSKAIWIMEAIGIAVCLMIAAVTFEQGNLTEEFSLPVLLVCLYLALCYFERYDKEKRYEHPLAYGFVYGAAFGFLALVRITNAALIGAILLSIVIELLIKRKYKNLIFNGFAFLLGVLVVAAPMFAYYAAHGLLTEMLEQVFLFGVQYSTEISLITKVVKIIRKCWNLLLLVVLPVVLLYVCCIKDRKLWTLSVSAACAVLCATIMGNAYVHYFTLGIPNVVLAIAIVYSVGNEKLLRKQKKAVCFVGIILVVMLLPQLAWNSATGMYRSLGLSNDQRRYQEVQIIKEAIPVGERDSIYVYGMGCSSWYARAEVYPAIRYCDWQDHYVDLVPEIGEEILQSLEDNEIKWIVIPTNPESTEGQIWSAIMENYTIYTQTKEYTLLVANP